MELTFAKTKDDLEEIADLRGKVFARRSYFDYYEQRKRYQTLDPWYKPEHSRIIRENGKIVSHISIIEKAVRFGPVVIKLGGIGDVLTHPHARGKGYSRLLMEDALLYMQKNKYFLSMLYGMPNYYHKFGYIEAVKDYKLFISPAKVKAADPAYRSRELLSDDIATLLKLYQKNSHDRILAVDRSEQYFVRLIKDYKKFIIVVDARDNPVGYVSFEDNITRQFVINEAITTSIAVSLALFHEALNQAPEPVPPTLEIRMAPGMAFVNHLLHFGGEMKETTYSEGEGNGMLVIIDLIPLLNELKPLFSSRLQHSEFNDCSDQLDISTDKETVTLIINNGELISVKKNPRFSNKGISLNSDYRYFVRNIVGYWSVSELTEFTDAKIPDKSCLLLLETLFPKTDPFMSALDYF